MSPKRVLVFCLLVVSAPMWLLARTRFGERFLLLLGLSWALGFGIAWLCAHGYVSDLPRAYLPVAWYAYRLYEASLWLWALQAASHLAYWLSVAVRECERPHPWYSGDFWTRRYASPAFDLFATIVAAITALAYMDQTPKIVHELGLWGIGAVIGSFVLLAAACHSNGQRLPVKPQLAVVSRKRVGKLYLSRLQQRAKRSREGLGHIFSRRDPALRALTRT